MDAFTTSYLHCALWLADTDPGLGEWAPHGPFTIANIEDETFYHALDDCENFQSAHEDDLARACALVGLTAEQAGCDFYFARNHAGASFADHGGDEVFQRLQDAAQVYRGFTLYLDECDGRIYGE